MGQEDTKTQEENAKHEMLGFSTATWRPASIQTPKYMVVGREFEIKRIGLQPPLFHKKEAAK